MSSIDSNSAAVRALLAIPRTPSPVSGAPKRFVQPKEQPLMHAWSIGTTRAAQTGADGAQTSDAQSRALAQSDCPPEVYIG